VGGTLYFVEWLSFAGFMRFKMDLVKSAYNLGSGILPYLILFFVIYQVLIYFHLDSKIEEVITWLKNLIHLFQSALGVPD